MKCVTDGGLREDGRGETDMFCVGAVLLGTRGLVLVVLIAAFDEDMIIRGTL